MEQLHLNRFFGSYFFMGVCFLHLLDLKQKLL